MNYCIHVFDDQAIGWFLLFVIPKSVVPQKPGLGDVALLKIFTPEKSKHKDKILGFSHYDNLLQGCIKWHSASWALEQWWVHSRSSFVCIWTKYEQIFAHTKSMSKVISVSFIETFILLKKTTLMKNKAYLIFKQTWHVY